MNGCIGICTPGAEPVVVAKAKEATAVVAKAKGATAPAMAVAVRSVVRIHTDT